MEKIKKSFQEGTVIVYVTSVGYLPIMNVSIQSLISQCKAENHYDIVILDTNADQFDKKNVKMLAGEKKNISIRFFEPIAWVKKLISLEIALEAYTPYFEHYSPGSCMNTIKFYIWEQILLLNTMLQNYITRHSRNRSWFLVAQAMGIPQMNLILT